MSTRAPSPAAGAPAADVAPVTVFETGTNTWQRLNAWPAGCATGCTVMATPLYLAAGLTALGARIEVHGDDIAVSGPTPLRGAPTRSLDDHRLAMSFAVAGLLAGPRAHQPQHGVQAIGELVALGPQRLGHGRDRLQLPAHGEDLRLVLQRDHGPHLHRSAAHGHRGDQPCSARHCCSGIAWHDFSGHHRHQ